MSFFANIYSLDELKRTYRKLAMTFHPDHGGNLRIMQELNAEYEKLLKTFQAYGYNPNYKRDYAYNSGTTYQEKPEPKKAQAYKKGERREEEKASYWDFLRMKQQAQYNKDNKKAFKERMWRQNNQHGLFDCV